MTQRSPALVCACALLFLFGCTPSGNRFALEEVPLEDPPTLATDLAFLPDGSFFMSAQDGVMTHYRLENGKGHLLGHFTVPGVHFQRDCGLITITVDPAFDRNRFLYAGHCISNQFSRITRLTFDASAYDRIAASAKEIVTVGDRRAKNPFHNIGSIGFEEDSTLWATFGDKVIRSAAQSTKTFLGKLIRIIPNRDPFGSGYTLPLRSRGGSGAVYASGFRMPWRVTRDSLGRYWVGDVGGNRFEEVNLVVRGGQNFGWDIAEGACRKECTGFTDPLISWGYERMHSYSRDDPKTVPVHSRIVWVGAEYQPRQTDPYAGDLSGRILFGDVCLGWVRAAAADVAGKLTKEHHLLHLPFVVAVRQGSDDFLYAATFPESLGASGVCHTGSHDRAHNMGQYAIEGKSRLWRIVRQAVQ